MWTFDRKRGALLKPDGALECSGVYSGQPGVYKNNPAMERMKALGPIPAGLWQIVSLTVEETPHGPYVLRLEPEPGTQTYNRDGFLIHGDNVLHPGTASEGCIIVPRFNREVVWNSGDRLVHVI